MTSLSSLQHLGDSYEHFDSVDGRMRPMRVIVEYVGKMPEGGIKPGEILTKITESELRMRHVFGFEGMTKPFYIEADTNRQLQSELESRKISADTLRAIRQLIARDSYAPKCGSVCDNQILIAVSYADLPQASQVVPPPVIGSPEVSSGSDSWELA